MKTAILALCLGILLSAGCAPFGGTADVKGPDLSSRETMRKFNADGSLLAETVTEKTAQGPHGRGTGLQSWEMPTLGLDQFGVRSGAAGATWYNIAAIQAAAANIRPLYIIGGLAILAGVIVGWLAGWGLGLAIAAAGGALLASAVLFDRYPWVALVAVAAGLAAAVWLIRDLRNGKLNGKVVQTLVPVIEANPEIKSEIAKSEASDKQFRDQVKKVKRTAGLA